MRSLYNLDSVFLRMIPHGCKMLLISLSCIATWSLHVKCKFFEQFWVSPFQFASNPCHLDIFQKYNIQLCWFDLSKRISFSESNLENYLCDWVFVILDWVILLLICCQRTALDIKLLLVTCELVETNKENFVWKIFLQIWTCCCSCIVGKSFHGRWYIDFVCLSLFLFMSFIIPLKRMYGAAFKWWIQIRHANFTD